MVYHVNAVVDGGHPPICIFRGAKLFKGFTVNAFHLKFPHFVVLGGVRR